ncbi:uncharacterized protein LOC128223690 [Mya arenaria]|uniref:uncharacterized protein LOC128223690 n=1 Tax=Mya arenaria TaxID=6604 RepID=UPI0022E82363|nr:uncharacterized protein LOC128223690 [Mya arenaria]
MKGLVILVLAATLFTIALGLSCYQCTREESLAACNKIKNCSDIEECYVDEIVTSTRVVYTAGCRAKVQCTGTALGKRSSMEKRQDIELIACSRCCDANDFCNKQLCGIQNTQGNQDLHQCYSCNLVGDMSACNEKVTCDIDQVCSSAAYIEGNQELYSFGCYPKQPCLAGTSFIVQHQAMLDHNTVGRRELHKVCNICCGDFLCNTGNCSQLVGKLRLLYEGSHLDLHTLKKIP